MPLPAACRDRTDGKAITAAQFGWQRCQQERTRHHKCPPGRQARSNSAHPRSSRHSPPLVQKSCPRQIPDHDTCGPRFWTGLARCVDEPGWGGPEPIVTDHSPASRQPVSENRHDRTFRAASALSRVFGRRRRGPHEVSGAARKPSNPGQVSDLEESHNTSVVVTLTRTKLNGMAARPPSPQLPRGGFSVSGSRNRTSGLVRSTTRMVLIDRRMPFVLRRWSAVRANCGKTHVPGCG